MNAPSVLEMTNFTNGSRSSARRSDYVWQYEYYDEEPVSFEGLRAHRYSIVIGFWVGLAVFVIFMFFVLTLLTKTGAPHQEGADSDVGPRSANSAPDRLNLDVVSEKAFSRPLLPESRSYFHFYVSQEPRRDRPRAAEPPGTRRPTDAEPPGARRPTDAEPPGTRRPTDAEPPGPRRPTDAEPPGARRPTDAEPPGARRPPDAEPPGARRPSDAEPPGTRRPAKDEAESRHLDLVLEEDRKCGFMSHFSIPNFVHLDHASALGDEDLLYASSETLKRQARAEEGRCDIH